MSVRTELASPTRQIDSDKDLLNAVLAKEKLGSSARTAFLDMLVRLKQSIGLSDRQRAWVQREAAALGIDVPHVDQLPPRTNQPSAWDPGSTKTLKVRVRKAIKGLDEKPARSKRKANKR